jgi:hypothetical protein
VKTGLTVILVVSLSTVSLAARSAETRTRAEEGSARRLPAAVEPKAIAPQTKETVFKLAALGVALETFKHDHLRYPVTIDELHKGRLKYAIEAVEGDYMDGWGRRFYYYAVPGRYVLISFGKSGKPTTRESATDSDPEVATVFTNDCFVGIPQGIGGAAGCGEK